MKTKLTYKQLQEALQEKSKIIGIVFEEAGDDIDFTKVKCLGEMDNAAKVEKIKALSTELADMNADYREFSAMINHRKAADDAAGFKGDLSRDNPGSQKEQKSLGKMFVESAAYKSMGGRSMLDIDMKSIVQTAAGWAPPQVRLPRVELYPLRPLRVADVFPTYNTGEASIRYMEETTHTNNAAEIAEETNAAAPTAAGEAAIAMTERNVPVENIAVWIPVTKQQMSDVAGIEQFINDRLTYMLRNRLDLQLCAGSGNTPALRGVINAGSIQTQAKSTDPTPDAILKAMTKVRGVSAGTGFGEPSAVLIHPNDYQDIALLRTADGIYIFGNPAEGGPKSIWGVPFVITSAETENTAVVGDFTNYSALYMRQGVEIEISNSHASLFTASTLAVMATMRCAAVYFRGTAFCKVTGL